MQRIVLCDVDGTLADMGKGLPGRRSPFDWSRVGEDTPIEPIVELVSLLMLRYPVFFMSGRDEVCRTETEAWLREHVGDPDPVLFMRPAKNNEPDDKIKRELYEQHVAGRYEVRYVLDDRAKVVRMWRDLGLTVLAVADGDF